MGMAPSGHRQCTRSQAGETVLISENNCCHSAESQTQAQLKVTTFFFCATPFRSPFIQQPYDIISPLRTVQQVDKIGVFSVIAFCIICIRNLDFIYQKTHFKTQLNISVKALQEQEYIDRSVYKSHIHFNSQYTLIIGTILRKLKPIG